MRILFISRAWGQNAGGMEQLSFEFIKNLSNLPEITPDIIVRRGHTRPGAILFILISLPSIIWRARQADIIHLGDPVLAFPGWLIKKIYHKPVAVTVHGLDVTYANPLYQLYLRVFAHFDLYLPISHHAQQLLRQLPISLTPKQVLYISPGVKDTHYDPHLSRQDLAQLLQQMINYVLSSNQSVLLTTGRLIKRKGHAWFIREVLPSLPSNTVYLIAGNGPEYEIIQKTAITTKLNLQVINQKSIYDSSQQTNASNSYPTVILLGRVSNAQLKILYNTVDAFIQPNIFVPKDTEGLGLVLLEAALCQRHVFAANTEGITDAIHNQKNGILLPPEDALSWQQTINDYLQNPITNSAARQYTLENYNWPKQAAKYSNALQALL